MEARLKRNKNVLLAKNWLKHFYFISDVTSEMK